MISRLDWDSPFDFNFGFLDSALPYLKVAGVWTDRYYIDPCYHGDFGVDPFSGLEICYACGARETQAGSGRSLMADIRLDDTRPGWNRFDAYHIRGGGI